MSEDTLRTNPGAVLAAAREERNLTRRDVADVLNLSVAVVEAIETGDQQHLPANVFTTGYIRAYAKLVDLDPEPLVADLSGPEPEEPLAKTPVATQAKPVQFSPAMIGTAVGVLLLSVVWVLWPEASSQGEAGLETTADQIQEVAVESEDEVPPEPAPDLAALQSSVSDTPDEPILSEDMDEPAKEDANPEVELESALREGYLPLTGAGLQLLDIDFTEECWVEIKNSEGVTLFADLGRPGRTFRFQGEGPFHVLLGYAPGALIRFNEEPVVLSPHTRNNVASVVLGQ